MCVVGPKQRMTHQKLLLVRGPLGKPAPAFRSGSGIRRPCLCPPVPGDDPPARRECGFVTRRL